MSVKELLVKIEQRLLKDKELSEGRYCAYMKLIQQALAEIKQLRTALLNIAAKSKTANTVESMAQTAKRALKKEIQE